MTQELTQDLLHKKLEYKCGCLYWKSRPNGRLDITKPAGTVDKDGYRRIMINKKPYFAHRLVFLMHYGSLPKFIDHIDGNPSNNAIENLRPATQSENMHNTGKRANNKSGYKGVSWSKSKNKWYAQIMVNRKQKNLGYFDTAESAFAAYCEAAAKHHKNYANFGFVD